MRTFVVAILFLFYSNKTSSQTSLGVDSSTVVTISQLDSVLQEKFLKLYSYGVDKDLYNRIDTIQYDFAFIETKSIDSVVTIKELYFLTKDSLPSKIFINGHYANASQFEDFLDYIADFKSVKQKSLVLKPIQTLQYSKTQIIYTGCIRRPKKSYKKTRKNDLKRTYQIQTYIDKKGNFSKISLQTPPKHPTFRVKLISQGF